MKKSILHSVIVMALLAMIVGCNPVKKADVSDLAGKWQRIGVDTISLVLDVTADGVWKYYKDNELLEKGTLEINADQMIMKHDVEEHAHDESGEAHDHQHPEDHIYKFALNEDKTELSIISEKSTTVYRKLN